MPRFFEGSALAALAGLGCLGLGRAWVLYRRGTRVVALDRHRSAGEILVDLLNMAALFLWGFEVVNHAWPLGVQLLPGALERPVIDHLAFKVSGLVCLVAGVTVYAGALQALGASWRLGIDRNKPGSLKTDGVFAWSRNPIYLAFDLCALGTFLIFGRLIFLGLAGAIIALLHAQVLREERFLEETFGDKFRAYRSRVGRYWTWRGHAR